MGRQPSLKRDIRASRRPVNRSRGRCQALGQRVTNSGVAHVGAAVLEDRALLVALAEGLRIGLAAAPDARSSGDTLPGDGADLARRLAAAAGPEAAIGAADAFRAIRRAGADEGLIADSGLAEIGAAVAAPVAPAV